MAVGDWDGGLRTELVMRIVGSFRGDFGFLQRLKRLSMMGCRSWD